MEVNRKLSTISIDLGIPDNIYEMIDSDMTVTKNVDIKRQLSSSEKMVQEQELSEIIETNVQKNITPVPVMFENTEYEASENEGC